MYRISKKKDRMYELDFDTKSDIKFNGKDDLYVGECTQELFSENIRRLMHKNKWPLEQCIAITASECERGKAFKEGEEEKED